MISIVVSSYKVDLYNQLLTSIRKTIGVPYEIIRIENPNLFGVCHAYNLGISRCQYDVVVLVHEDLIFHSDNWGKEIIKLFECDKQIGLIGLVGCKAKSYVASGWITQDQDLLAYNFIQSNYKLGTQGVHHLNIEDTTQVATIDGFFMASKKNILEHHPFDSSLLRGYHGYDLDISLSIGQRYKIVVSHKLRVEHLSEGNADESWFIDIMNVNNKYKNILPVYHNALSYSRRLEYDNLKFLIRYLTHNKVQGITPIKVLFRIDYVLNLGLWYFIKINIYFIYIKLFLKA